MWGGIGMDKKKKLEEEVAYLLTEGEMERRDPKKEAVDRLPAKYEVRIQTTQDLVVEETKLYRQMAEEIDDRYDKYLKKQDGQQQSEAVEKRYTNNFGSEKTQQGVPEAVQSLNKNYDSNKERKTGRVEGMNVYEQAFKNEEK
ncbi:hypothetical protein HMPREF0083_01969 [Aneurinibacillus aneurinilyticus ATCC 12856]|uniref:Uncharacterized protein n=2 Tax=Aneurinibacillus aneurinilyticus TaxID=1391 RepID=U1YCW0_ANEAE|nr:hypothetical protein HMPREF0083_01969 [Aneurinibacillus aneurinilyticus ATCC 12856]